MKIRSLDPFELPKIREVETFMTDVLTTPGTGRDRGNFDVKLGPLLKGSGAGCLIIEVSGKVVAALNYRTMIVKKESGSEDINEWKYYGSEHNIAVDQAYRKKGLASKLLEEYFRRQKERYRQRRLSMDEGAGIIFSTYIHRDNISAKRIHKSNGFQKTDIESLTVEEGFDLYVKLNPEYCKFFPNSHSQI